MTKNQEYIENNGQQCPFCGSDDIHMQHRPTIGGGRASNPMTCDTCDKNWKDEYELIGYSEVQE